MRELADLPDKGILRAEAGRTKFSLTRYAPSEDLAFFVEHYWLTRWDLRGQAPYRQVILSHPCVNLVFEKGDQGVFTGVHGIRASSDSKLLQGEGTALGIKFKPGGFYPFWRQPLYRLTGVSVACGELFGMEMSGVEQRLFEQDSGEKMAEAAEAFLRGRRPASDPQAELASRIVETAARERGLAKAADLAAVFGMSLRSLQRLFGRYVGISPKWVIRRFRLHEAAQMMEAGEQPDWAQLAHELGYYDQAHFIKNFKEIVGKSPYNYMRMKGRPL